MHLGSERVYTYNTPIGGHVHIAPLPPQLPKILPLLIFDDDFLITIIIDHFL